MPYNINRYDGTLIASVDDGTIDSTLDIKLIGRNYAGYGEAQNENMVHMLENFAGTTEPPRKITGQIWFDSTNKKLKFYDGVKFRNTGGAEISGTQPSGLTTGDFWYNTQTNQVFAWSGSEFILVGPQAVQNAEATEFRSTVLVDIYGLTRPVIQGLVNGKIIFIISNAEFTVSTNPENQIIGFNIIKQGLTLVNTGSDGVTLTNHRYWGTASNSDKLNGFLDTDFVKAKNGLFSELARFYDPGFTVGNDDDLKIYIDNNSPVIINQTADSPIIFKTKVTSGSEIIEKIPLKIQGNSLLPGSNSQTINIGSSAEKFNAIYATTVNANLEGTADQSTRLNVGGTYMTGSITDAVSTVAARDSNGYITARKFVGPVERATNIEGGSPKAIVYQNTANITNFLPIGAAKQVLSISDSGNLNWTNINDIFDAGKATQIRVTDTIDANTDHYITFTSGNSGDQYLKVDSSRLIYNPYGNILTTSTFEGNLRGVADQSDKLKVDNNNNFYVVGSLSATGNTVAVRDVNGDITANRFKGLADRVTNITGGNNTTLLGSMPYQSNTNATTLLSPNITVTKNFLAQTGTGTNGAPPVWSTLTATDIPGHFIGTSNIAFNRLSSPQTLTGVSIDGSAATVPASGLTGTTLASNVTDSSLTKVGTIVSGSWQGSAIVDSYLATITTPGKVSNSATTATSNNAANTIVSRDTNGNFIANVITGTSTAARYADLAEKYLSDVDYEVGTVLMIGGEKEVTACQVGFRAIGVVSKNPAYLMNSELEGGVAVALKGRVPVKVTGSVIKGQRLVAAANGTAQTFGNYNDTFAIALETNIEAGIKLVECLIL